MAKIIKAALRNFIRRSFCTHYVSQTSRRQLLIREIHDCAFDRKGLFDAFFKFSGHKE